MIGQTLLHYRITDRLGAGGMGEVYRAKDTNLDREVAIKVLPPEVARDVERLGRFRREAKLLAALNHTNIASIHGLEEADGQPFLVLELVEGEDLKERLGRGPIPLDEALEIAKQVAEALEEAHGHGIVHRDLKPANIKLAPDGQVKVLDFGLAKAWAGDLGSATSSFDLSASPTLAHSGTQAGVILAPGAYMTTEFGANNDNADMAAGDAELVEYAEKLRDHLFAVVAGKGGTEADPQEVADKIFECATAETPVHNPVGADAQMLMGLMGEPPRQDFIVRMEEMLLPKE